MIITKFKLFVESAIHSDFGRLIPKSIHDLQKLFSVQGKKLYVVGGAVRDFLTNRTPKDFDLATDAKPEEIMKILSGKYTIESDRGKSFGVVVVYTDDAPEGMEIATFRKDVTIGRKPEVDFRATIEDDVNRRDLTFNALFYDIERGEIIDLVGGLEDIKNGVIRMVGDPIERIDEDPLRILRSFRFATRYDRPLHPTLLEAIKKRKKLETVNAETSQVQRISGERIWNEMKQSFKQCERGEQFVQFLELINQCNMWEEIFPGSEINTELKPTKSLEVYLTNIFKNENPKNLASKLNDRYKIEFDMSNVVEFLVDLQNLKPENILTLHKKMLRTKVTSELIQEWCKLNNMEGGIFELFPSYKPITNPKDVMKMGFKGVELGKEIDRLESDRIKKILIK